MSVAVGPSAPRRLWSWQFTPRQAQVLELVALGLTNEQVADASGVSKATVHYHLIHIFLRLDVTNRVAAARWWWENVEAKV